MKGDDAGGTVETRDPEIDAEAIMRQIRENIRRQRAQAEAQGLDRETFAEGLHAPHVTTRFDSDLYEALQRMSVGHDKVGVGLLLTGSTVPLVAPLVQRIRTALHHLVIYYVNTLAGQQARFNEHVVRAVTALVKGVEEDPTPGEVEALQQEVAQLRAQIEQLEARVERANE
jgi:hypothetical protein